MDVEILKDPLPYKYTVFSPKAVKKDATRSYEYLYGHSKKHVGFINRCLVVTDYEIKNGELYGYIFIFNLMDTITCVGGSYVQYDTIAYPCEAIMSTKSSKGVDAGVKDSARSWLPTAIKAIAGKAWSFVAGNLKVKLLQNCPQVQLLQRHLKAKFFCHIKRSTRTHCLHISLLILRPSAVVPTVPALWKWPRR